MRPSRPRPDLLLVLARQERYGIAELLATIRYRYDPAIATGAHHAGPGDVLSPTFGHSGIYDRYADLHVRAAIDTDGIIPDRRSFAWACEYRPRTVDLERASSMLATLQRIRRQLAALDQQLGAPTTFADYLARFATAVGITRYAVYSQPLRADGTHWIWLDADRMRAWVDHHEPPTPRPWP